jgi:outer membrane protein OmpA-like peptidoglycan-associated protein
MNRKMLIGSFVAVLMAGCAHSPPDELLQARAAYQRASEGPAKEYTPAGLHVAKNSLMVAERSFRNKEDSWLIRSQAYIAMRKAELAESMARTEMYQRMSDEAKQREETLEQEIIETTKEELESVTQQLDDKQTAAAMAHTQQQLATEKQARAEAERRAAVANAELQRIASVKQDERGTVVTLSGAILFASGKSELLPTAQRKLDEVAQALLSGDPESTFVVEGHTDSQGSTEKNRELSLARAEAVRTYLISQEIAADRIKTEGLGEDRPIADNASPEGRANNRRVEIVIKPGQTS